MAAKPELLVTAASIDELIRLMDAGADAFLIGEARYGLRLAGSFTVESIKQAVEAARPRGVKIYVAVNNLMDNETAAMLPEYLKQVAAAGADAVVFGDPAVLMAARTAAPDLKLHWNAEMTSTSYGTANFWGRKGAVRVVLARELNMEQVIETKANTALEVQVQVHGMTNIYHSKRSLVHSYADYQSQTLSAQLQDNSAPAGHIAADQERGLYLIEVERPDERYPIYEDDNGTHIMSSDDICMLENLHELLEAGIDSFKIEGILKSPDYNEAVVRSYRKVIDLYCEAPELYEFEEQWLDGIRALQDPQRELSFGFFFKEQVY
ncbi:U32 family peptidase [Paenibacillaceae bacterium]|nr:U32 family peptidase [Paenibacillaceae bacterium]